MPSVPARQALATGGGHLRGALAHWLAAAVAACASSRAPRAVGRLSAPLGRCLMECGRQLRASSQPECRNILLHTVFQASQASFWCEPHPLAGGMRGTPWLIGAPLGDARPNA
eukprot:8461590-Alexandrium_andersonii.AAC.2